MVFTPRRRRLFRVICIALIFTCTVVLFQHLNSSSKYDGVSYTLGFTTNYERKPRRRTLNVTKVLGVNVHLAKAQKTEHRLPTNKRNVWLDVKKKPNITWVRHPWTSSLRGFLNVHVWLDWCGSTVNDLRRNIHFPKYPDVRLKTKLFHLSHDAHNYGQRVFGYLHPPRTGRYSFAISSDDSSELWLSSDQEPRNSRLIAWVGNLSDPLWDSIVGRGEFSKYRSQVSTQIFLRRNSRYFVEALHKQSLSSDHLLVAWKIPRVGNFSYITSGRISQYVHPHELYNLDVTRYARHIPLTPAVLQKPFLPRKLIDEIPVGVLNPGQNFKNKLPALKFRREGKHNRFDSLKDVILDITSPQSIAPQMYSVCEYKPSYRIDFKVARYEGVYLVHETAVYPDDGTYLEHVEKYKSCFETRMVDSHGELPPNTDKAKSSRDKLNNVEYNSQESTALNTSEKIPVVDYRDNRKQSKANVTFNKRKILAILSHRTTDSNKKYQASATTRFGTTSFFHGNNARKRKNNMVLEMNKSDYVILARNEDSVNPRESPVQTISEGRNGSTIVPEKTLDVEISLTDQRKNTHENESVAYHSEDSKYKTLKSRNITKEERRESHSWRRLKHQLQKHPRKVNENKEQRTKKIVEHVGVRRAVKQPKENIIARIPDDILPNHKVVAWHRKRRKPPATDDVFVSATSPMAVTLRKLQRSGQWAEIKAYAKRKRLLFTSKTWMYVTWKYLRYEKPKKPHDRLTEFIYKQYPPLCRSDGNIRLNEGVAKGVVNKYMKDLRKRYGSEVYLKNIVNVEENHDVLKGDRYLIELDLGFYGENETLHVSDYVYLPLGDQSFCSPQDLVWRKNVTVHVIVPVKNQGKWVQHFIDDMSELCEATQDSNVNVIIVDFNSTDIDVKAALKRSSLKRYRFLSVNGSFQRALGVQIGADAVENPDDILFTCDLHLDFPNNMIQVIRKHCIQGKMAFSPMVLRLECGFTPSLPYGEWETMGYGLFAIFKSDFDRIGGMNIDEFKTKWGGEDWEMVDRFLQKGMEIERMRVPKFYHFFHSKQGMWGSYGFEDNVSGEDGDNIVEDALVPGYDSGYAARYNFNQPLQPQY